MVILRCFRLICITGVVASIISFVLGTLAISTGSWLLSQGEVPTMQFPDDTVPDDLGSSVAPGNLSDWSRNNTENTTTTGTVTTARTTELTATTGQTATDAWMRSTGTMSPSDAGENVTTAELQIITVIATSGLWHVCQAKIQDGVVVGEWLCSNIIGSLALMQSSKHLIYFQSMLAFELISVAATLAGSCIATVAIYKQQPLAVLVAAFTMFFAGLFMLVGHVMMLSIHKANNDGTNENSWYYGWSFIVAWLSFCMCLVSGTINCVVYRNFRKMSEELTGTPSRVKYANRPPPVNLGSSI
ncbi:germ cell-specific gene 1-like protein isoform X2 [Acanthaster planci]|uniref:Germ cell-specific gene 1-like protein isoform X2 n=1 Tax=Acanthaster planci TaxID=133434 RepID=A0A8B7ZCE0_ACAPL|nr:germ cell-specific gene 1-like protein isoform X2 [Acanthaster planci]